MNNEKWKLGNFPSTVVSDKKVHNTYFPTPPNKTESEDTDVEYYGGYLVCESIANNQHAKLIAAAPEMLEALQILLGDIDQAPNKLTREQKIEIARKAIKKASGNG